MRTKTVARWSPPSTQSPQCAAAFCRWNDLQDHQLLCERVAERGSLPFRLIEADADGENSRSCTRRAKRPKELVDSDGGALETERRASGEGRREGCAGRTAACGEERMAGAGRLALEGAQRAEQAASMARQGGQWPAPLAFCGCEQRRPVYHRLSLIGRAEPFARSW